ncbi:uncharacterized protein Z519_07975 [Cladophialophora bantiana CBS 173.52]|uniref:PAC domain-containing protein n=1 Tax=Cladophialophora bantiana (strain ATCC 10958 / CBS 173.52 / CDC B-1940 / NIH 8579) TaxID=1442370 RepID=A0A0D2EM62_CLAB1|nr:uncharacterized protein Z519_07975 [Cladophialophora bantiana CBS 173.52]KIW91081.1 hypothetical protein Z519_07975 [Cladophialophora bantiana CBS 173.52]
MDLERIKQSLRLRSSRSKKPRKQPTVQSNAEARPSQPGPKNIAANGSVKTPPRLITKAKQAKLRPTPEVSQPLSVDVRNTPVQRPDFSNTSTDFDPKPSPSDRPPRIDCHHQDDGQEPGSNPSSLPRAVSEVDARLVLDSESSALDFDLHPPPLPSQPRPPSVESLSESLFSSGHLNTLLRDPQYLARFTSFLTMYRPQYHPVLLRYLETQKAIKAIEYANAIAEGIPSSSDDGGPSNPKVSIAATLDRAFEELSSAAFRLMVDSALPMYITYNLVKLVTEYLIDEITGKQTFTKDLARGLSEVFCLTDPKQQDNPIIFASQEFYRQTGYGPDYVIGQNCRFLQGPKTNSESVARLRQSIQRGEDICETLLNYRRDGRPFINLLMIAPLHDDKGNVKYHIGAQVDVTGMVEHGKRLGGLKRYLSGREIEKHEREAHGNGIGGDNQGHQKPKALGKLRELSEMFDLEESAVVRSHERSASASREDDAHSVASVRKVTRRILGDTDANSGNADEEFAEDDDQIWELGQSGRSGLSGQLPGVYDSYMLIRPAPSLRIIFVSSVLRRRVGNIIQHPFLSHVAASTNTLKGLKESFFAGVPFSAKINLLLEAGDRQDGTVTRVGNKLQNAGQGRVCWVSATPMLGSDDRIGVWMAVIVENTKVPTETKPGTLLSAVEDQAYAKQPRSSDPRQVDIPTKTRPQQQTLSELGDSSKREFKLEDPPIKPKRLEDTADQARSSQLSPLPAEEGTTDFQEGVLGEQGHELVSPEDKPLVEQEEEKTVLNHTSTDPLVLLGNDKDGFVQTNGRISDSPSPQHAHDELDGHGESNTPKLSAVNDALERAMSGTNTVKTWVTPISPDDKGFANGLNGFHSFSDEEKTPVNSRKGGFADYTPSPSRPGTSGMDSTTGKSNSKHYMDYLRHPGSRPSSEYNRALSGSFLATKYNPEEEAQDEWDDFNDSECARSPYSVD